MFTLTKAGFLFNGLAGKPLKYGSDFSERIKTGTRYFGKH